MSAYGVCCLLAEIASPKPRTSHKKSTPSSGAMADVAGAVGMFGSVSQDNVFPDSSISRRKTTANLQVRTVHRSAEDPPALPPRAPIYKNPSSVSCKTRRSHSSDHSLSGSVVSSHDAVTAATETAAESQDESLDVFVPLSVDAQSVRQDERGPTAGTRDKTGDEPLQPVSHWSKGEQTASQNVVADSQDCRQNYDNDGLDVVVCIYDESGMQKKPTSGTSEQATVANVPANSVDDGDDDDGVVAGVPGQYRGGASRPPRTRVVRRLTRKETRKLSRNLTRKMSCRQQHALMMEAEFDEFDELDVVVEGDGIAEDDDNDDNVVRDDELSSVSDDHGAHGGEDELKTARDGDTDAGFDQRVTAKLHYDRLQVIVLHNTTATTA